MACRHRHTVVSEDCHAEIKSPRRTCGGRVIDILVGEAIGDAEDIQISISFYPWIYRRRAAIGVVFGEAVGDADGVLHTGLEKQAAQAMHVLHAVIDILFGKTGSPFGAYASSQPMQVRTP